MGAIKEHCPQRLLGVRFDRNHNGRLSSRKASWYSKRSICWNSSWFLCSRRPSSIWHQLANRVCLGPRDSRISKLTTPFFQIISLRSCTISPRDWNKRDDFWQWANIHLRSETSSSCADPTPPSFRQDPPILCRSSHKPGFEKRSYNMGFSIGQESCELCAARSRHVPGDGSHA
jgi:hypothetical protein